MLTLNSVNMMLAGVSGIAIVIALVSLGALYRVWARDRLRAQARVAALAAEIGALDPAEPLSPGAATDLKFLDAVAAGETPGANSGRRLLVALCCSALAVGLIVALGAAVRTSGSTAASRGASMPARQATARAQPASGPLLSLLSIHQRREESRLVVSGLVKNVSAAPLAHVSAVVMLYDRTGAYLDSGRAPLEFTLVPPGAESPFSVEAREADRAARIRISFRTADGLPIAHVDGRRNQ